MTFYIDKITNKFGYITCKFILNLITLIYIIIFAVPERHYVHSNFRSIFLPILWGSGYGNILSTPGLS